MTELNLLFWGLSIGVLGKVLLGITVINVHSHIVKEHRIDMDVLTAMKKEKVFAVTGVFLMVLGYILEVTHFGYLPF